MPDPAAAMDESIEGTVVEVDPIAENAVPAPNVDVTQTLQWLSIDNLNLLDVSSLIIMNNMEVVRILLSREPQLVR